jgi:hypothetical protein
MNRLLLALTVLLGLQGCGGSSGDNDRLQSRGLEAVDLDQDGIVDIVGLASNVDTARGEHRAFILLNSNSTPGKIASQQRISIPGARWVHTFSLATGDLNQDGLVDIAIQNGRKLYLLLQKPGNPGEFNSPGRIAGAITTYSIAIADFNQDGFNDIALYGSKLSILFQDSINPGSFLPPKDTGIHAGALAVGDLDGDLIGDLAIIDGEVVKVLLQDPGVPGSFAMAAQLDAGDQPHEIAIADLDQDSRLDLIVVDRGTVKGRPYGSLIVFLQDAGNPGSFPRTDRYGALCQPHELTVADLNHDNLPDLAVATNDEFCATGDLDDLDRVLVLLKQDLASPGRFEMPSPLPNIDSTSEILRALDYDADGYNDLLLGGGEIDVLRQRASSPGRFHGRRLIYDLNQ